MGLNDSVVLIVHAVDLHVDWNFVFFSLLSSAFICVFVCVNSFMYISYFCVCDVCIYIYIYI